MDDQGMSGSASAFDGKFDRGCAKPALAREPENANGAYVAVPFVGKAAKGTARVGANRTEAGMKNGGTKRRVAVFVRIDSKEKGDCYESLAGRLFVCNREYEKSRGGVLRGGGRYDHASRGGGTAGGI